MEIFFPLADVAVPWPFLVLLGLAVGVLMGFFGVGGGWLTAPALNILGFPIVFAIGTSLAYTAAAAVVGAARHYRLGNLGFRLGAILGVSGMVGMELARRLVLFLESAGVAAPSVRVAYVLLLWGVGLSIVAESVRGRSQSIPAERGAEDGRDSALGKQLRDFALPPLVRLRRARMTISVWVLAVIGVLVGLLAGFLGTGGGFIIVPLLVYLLGVETRVAVASSLLSIVLATGYGALGYGLAGRVEPLAAGLMFAGALAGAQLGALATARVQARSIRVLLGLSLLLVGLAVLLQQFGLGRASLVVLFGTTLAISLLIVSFLARPRQPSRS